MEEKQPKKKAANKMLGKKTYIVGGIIALAVIAVLVIGLAVGKTDAKPNHVPQIPTVKIKTPYIDLLIPMEVSEYITHEESTHGDIYTCTFYMNYSDKKLLLWLVDFGDSNAADWVGILKTDQGDIPVAMTGFVTSDEDLSALGEEGSQLYGACMQGYSVMRDGIMADSRFTAERPVAVGEDKEMKLTYWTVTLPSKIQVHENSEDGNYTATFSGEVAGEMVLLYRITIGEEQTGSLLGYFEVDGVKKAVSVESFTLVERESWNEQDYATAYHMMETINQVIQTIMSGKKFSTEP